MCALDRSLVVEVSSQPALLLADPSSEEADVIDLHSNSVTLMGSAREVLDPACKVSYGQMSVQFSPSI